MTQWLSLNDAAIQTGIIEWADGEGLKDGIEEYSDREHRLWATLKRVADERDELKYELKQQQKEPLDHEDVDRVLDSVNGTCQRLEEYRLKLSPYDRVFNMMDAEVKAYRKLRKKIEEWEQARMNRVAKRRGK